MGDNSSHIFTRDDADFNIAWVTNETGELMDPDEFLVLVGIAANEDGMLPVWDLFQACFLLRENSRFQALPDEKRYAALRRANQLMGNIRRGGPAEEEDD